MNHDLRVFFSITAVVFHLLSYMLHPFLVENIMALYRIFPGRLYDNALYQLTLKLRKQ